MEFLTVLMAAACALGAAAGAKLPSDTKEVHHSTKKQLTEPGRFPRKVASPGPMKVMDKADLDPALAYALPPVGLGYGRYGSFGHGFDASALTALLNAGLHAPGPRQPKTPVLHASPLRPYGALLSHATPIVEPKQEGGFVPITPTLQTIKAQSHVFVDPPKYYSHVEHDDEYKDYASKYQFGYRVRDFHTGNDFGQTETRDGHMTTGHYHVLLPDGRVQNVNYWSDHSGFHAKVSYEGQSTHP